MITIPLQRNLTLPTGVVLPLAYGDVTDWDLRGQANIARVWVTWWADKAAHDAGKPPVIENEDLTLTLQEQHTGAAGLIGTLYQIIMARPEYAGTVLV